MGSATAGLQHAKRLLWTRGGRRRHETVIKTHAAAKTRRKIRPLPARPCEPLFAKRLLVAGHRRGVGAKYRRGQIGAAAVCRHLRELPSQSERPCQGALPPHPFSV